MSLHASPLPYYIINSAHGSEKFSRNHSLSGLRSTMGFFNILLSFALFCYLGNVGSHGLYPYPVMYSGLIPPNPTQLMTGNFISRKIHPNQEKNLKTYNKVWGNVGGGLEKGKFLNITFKNIIKTY